MEELRRQRPHTLWTDLKNLWYEALGSEPFLPPEQPSDDGP